MTPKTAKQLHDAISAFDEMQTYTSDWTRDEFLQTRSLQLIVWKLTEIVEDALRQAEASQPSLRDQIPELPDVVNTMDRLTQEHSAVDFAQLWDTVVDDAPLLRQKLLDAKREALPVAS
jgi:uncharacterized protein with HEPN domain